MNPTDEIEHQAHKRATWAATALSASAEELREVDEATAERFEAEAGDVAGTAPTKIAKRRSNQNWN